MTTDPAREIPPLDNAADISRSTDVQLGDTLADARNWAGYMVLLLGILAVVTTAALVAADLPGPAIVAAIIAVVALFGGAALIFVENRRRRTEAAPADEDEPSPDAWQGVIPPRA